MHWPPPGHALPSDSIGKASTERLVLLFQAVAAHKAVMPHCPQLPRGKGGAKRTGEGIFLLFLTPAAPDYHVLRSEPRKHHSAMLQLGWLPSPEKGRRRRTEGCGCEHTGVSTRGPRARLHSALPAVVCSLQPAERGGKVACCLQTCLFF